ncbi:hypothetical protein [Formosa sp. S-31]|uniref:hypothetical protein n=1 Tax=Formosa sp. S-31 TaxID=2790949 RepID=UPI003EB8B889
MSDIKEVKRLLREIVGATPNLPIPAKVLSVSGDVCTVEVKGGLKLTDVKLKATSNGDTNYVLLTPKVGSNVVMLSHTGKLDNLTIIKVDEFEKIVLVQGALEVEVDSTDSKVGVKNETCSLNEVFQDLATLLKQLKVYTPVGPSGLPLPDTITAIEAFETKFKALLK